MHHDLVEDMRLNYDPANQVSQFIEGGIQAVNAASLLPTAVPWPAGLAPTPAPLNPAPAESDDLSRFSGYDAIIVTWTAAEASALASLLSPGYPTASWYQYRHGITNYLPLVTGPKAPFNDSRPEMARYFHSLGLYFPVQIGRAKVLLFKSGLHMDYDGPDNPLINLITDLVSSIGPKLLITTGTGGGIGTDVMLGDVVIAAYTKFDCISQFKNKPYASTSINTSPLPAGALGAITTDLTSVNALRLPTGSQNPLIWASARDAIVTTDFFGFDDSTDHYKLQGMGRACDMGDAMVGLALQQAGGTDFYAIRNASDPQIPNPNNDMKTAKATAGDIYAKYGGITTAASVIASWAVITSRFS